MQILSQSQQKKDTNPRRKQRSPFSHQGSTLPSSRTAENNRKPRGGEGAGSPAALPFAPELRGLGSLMLKLLKRETRCILETESIIPQRGCRVSWCPGGGDMLWPRPCRLVPRVGSPGGRRHWVPSGTPGRHLPPPMMAWPVVLTLTLRCDRWELPRAASS